MSGVARKIKRDKLRNKLKSMGVQHPNKKMSEYWKDYKAGRKI